MKNTKSFILNRTWRLATLFLGLLFLSTSCSEESTSEIPENWVTVDSEALTISYEGGELSRELTLTDGVNPSYVYITGTDDWCLATVDDGSTVNIKVEPSNLIVERTSTLTLVYDEQHKVELSVKQNAAPPTLVTSIQFPESMTEQTVNMGVTFDLNELITVLPENASTKALTFTMEGSENIAILDGGILKTQKTPGTIKLKASTTDGTGITVEKTITVGGLLVHDRTGWAVSTCVTYSNGQNYVTDGTTGKPEHILDDDLLTFLSLVKPGGKYGEYVAPDNNNLYFIVDMKENKQFNFIQWGNRGSNSAVYLRVWGITMYGSNDGTNFETIEEDIVLDYSNNTSVFTIDLKGEHSYRYVKVEYTNWSNIGGGSTSGASLQVSTFGTGISFK